MPLCVGLFLDPDFAEIAFNNLDATELAEGKSSTTEPGAVTSSKRKTSSTAARNKVPKRPLSEVSVASTNSDQEDNMELTASSVVLSPSSELGVEMELGLLFCFKVV